MPREYKVISADSHVNIPETAYVEYFPAKLRDQAPPLRAIGVHARFVVEDSFKLFFRCVAEFFCVLFIQHDAERELRAGQRNPPRPAVIGRA